MKVTVFTVNDTYKLKSEEGDVLQIQPAAGWKTIRGAKAWAEKHGYEFDDHKEETKMASKSKITNVTVDLKFNTAYVYYESGVEKMYPADKMPKTVSKWLAEHEAAEEEVDPVEEEPEAVDQEAGQADQEVAQIEPESAQNDQENAQIEPESAQNDQENAQIEPESAQIEQEVVQTHREPVRRSQTPQVKSLSLDIVEAVVSGLLMASRLSLIALAYLLMGLASTCQAMGAAVEWLTPRATSLIDRSRAAWTEMVRPACRTAAAWMAEAVWYVLI